MFLAVESGLRFGLRLVVPSYNAWKQTGAVLSALVTSGQARWADVSRSLVNDILLAMSCREAGVVLVTMNTRAFARIARVARGCQYDPVRQGHLVRVAQMGRIQRDGGIQVDHGALVHDSDDLKGGVLTAVLYHIDHLYWSI